MTEDERGELADAIAERVRAVAVATMTPELAGLLRPGAFMHVGLGAVELHSGLWGLRLRLDVTANDLTLDFLAGNGELMQRIRLDRPQSNRC